MGSRALTLSPGDQTQEQILAAVGDGVLVQSVSGLHSGVNATTGDFSVGIQGLMVRGGVVAEPVCELGEARYWYRRDGRTIGKTVTFYLFRYVDGDTSDHDEEVEEARWMPLSEARKALTHAAEREMVELALACLEKDR